MKLSNQLVIMVIIWDIAVILVAIEVMRCFIDKHRLNRHTKYTKNKVRKLLDK